VPFGSGADLFVVNTCTVTGKAEQKARRIIRAALVAHPGSVVLVTGCYAQMDPSGLAALDERAIVVPGEEKAVILDLAAWLADRWQGHGDLLDAVREWMRELAAAEGEGRRSEAFAFHPDGFAFHSRPALKIQDGCDNRCTYCRVCLARGPSVSLESSEVLRRAQALEEGGRAEIVLTGVNLSHYRDGDLGFPGLLRSLLKGTRRIAFRLSSYEPERIDAGFLEIFAHERVRPHAHLPVQSGSDAVLARMGRAYRRDKVMAAADALRRVKGDLFLAADIIAGFPGETEDDFASTLELCTTCDFSWIHAFPYSPRPGTRAESMRPRVPERIAGLRVATLAALARKGRTAYIARNVDSEVEAVLERSGPMRYGTSGNYLKIRIEGVPASLGPGASVRCRIVKQDEDSDNSPGDADAAAVYIPVSPEVG
jgi:threonylcarbamoyladenosine tRNA methylthiotransferase MtaB